MIGLTDQGLARLAIAAGRIPRKVRGRWLQGLAERLEAREPSGHRPAEITHRRGHGTRSRGYPSAEAVRQREARARRQNGRCVFKVEVDHDRVVLALLEAGRMSEGEALRRDLVERAIAAVVQEWATRWTEAR